MSRITEPDALQRLERRMVETFGVGREEYDAGIRKGPVPRAYLAAAIRIADSSGIVDLLAQWDAEQRKSKAGKKALIPFRALVVLYLLNMQLGLGVTYSELARSLAHSFTAEHFALLGIRSSEGDVQTWYSRISETTYRLIALMNPRPTPLRKILDAKEFRELQAWMKTPSQTKLNERNQDRLDEFCNRMVEASLRFLPTDLWGRYKGNIAIDATKAHIRGKKNSASKKGARANPDPYSGRYMRQGSHGGKGAKTDVAAYELETAVMIWNKPGETTLFPSLVSAISCHDPGKYVGHAAQLMRRHKALGFDRFEVAADRAYNGENVSTFHFPAAALGVDLVIDYKKTELGRKANFEDLILVDGNWYVKWMPPGLINVSKEIVAAESKRSDATGILYRAEHPRELKTLLPSERKIAAKQERHAERDIVELRELVPSFEERIKMREPYRMIPKGVRDKDGFQRFMYPPIAKMVAKPPVPPTRTTITIPPVLPVNEKAASGGKVNRKPRTELSKKTKPAPPPIKFSQRYPYKTEVWRRRYGMRNLVEASNSLLKSPLHGDIEKQQKRSGRGYAATYLALAFAVVASNLRRIFTFFVEEAERSSTSEKQKRERRRKDEFGKPLARTSSETADLET